MHQELDRFFDLRVFAFSGALGVVEHFDVRFHLGPFHELTLFVPETDFGNAKDQSWILEKFPPDGGAGAWDRHADQLADPEMLVNPGKQMGVGVVALAGQNHAFPVPSFVRFPADALPAGKKFKIGFAAQKRGQGIVKVTTPIEPRINDQSLLGTLPTQGFGVGFPKTLVAHPANVHVPYRAVAQFID